MFNNSSPTFQGAAPLSKIQIKKWGAHTYTQKQYLQLKWEIPKVHTFRNKGV